MKQIFLSSVTSEFGQLRQRLANVAQRTQKCHVRHQDDFFERGVKTLQMLFEEIQASDIVVHLIGNEAGWCVPSDQAGQFLQQHPEFSSRFSQVGEGLAKQAIQGELPATQWEAWLGFYFNKKVFKYQLKATGSPESAQIVHVERHCSMSGISKNTK